MPRYHHPGLVVMHTLWGELIRAKQFEDFGPAYAEKEFVADYQHSFKVKPSAELVAEFSSLRIEVYRIAAKGRCCRRFPEWFDARTIESLQTECKVPVQV